jgi:hypothetical protein
MHLKPLLITFTITSLVGLSTLFIPPTHQEEVVLYYEGELPSEASVAEPEIGIAEEEIAEEPEATEEATNELTEETPEATEEPTEEPAAEKAEQADVAYEPTDYESASSFRPFITTRRTTTDNENIMIPTPSLSHYDFTIDWGDGTTGHYQGQGDPDPVHSYTTAGNHRVVITAEENGFQMYLYNDRIAEYESNAAKLRSVDQWGDFAWMTMYRAFAYAIHLVILAEDTPNLSQVVDMSYMFMNATNLTGNFSGRDTSNVEDMTYLFYSTSFNQPV